MVFLVLEPHRPLYFRRRIDKRTQRIAGQGMIISASVDVFELQRFVVAALSIGALEKKALDFVGGIQSVTFLFVQVVGVTLQCAANIGCVRRASLVDDLAKDQDFARAKDIRRSPVERAPVNPQPQITFALRRKAPDRRSIEGEVVPTLDEELLVIVKHVQAAFEIAEKHGDRLDPLFIGQILEPLFLDLVSCDAVPALFLRLQIQFFEFVIRECQKIAQFVGHESPSSPSMLPILFLCSVLAKSRLMGTLKWLVATFQNIASLRTVPIEKADEADKRLLSGRTLHLRGPSKNGPRQGPFAHC